jgi:hypothetical protein
MADALFQPAAHDILTASEVEDQDDDARRSERCNSPDLR